MKTGFELGYPTAQNAIDLIPKWTSWFPESLGVTAGNMYFIEDKRIIWAAEKFGESLEGRRVLELGPLEGGHTALLTRRGAIVDAVEANRVAYIKCLIAKELLQIQNARFLLGDCVKYVEKTPERYDLVVACGVLYHMDDPIRLLRALAALADDLFLWTVYVDDPSIPPTRTEKVGDLDVRIYAIPYGPKEDGFTGGEPQTVGWMDKSDILGALTRLGYESVEVEHDRPKGADGSPASYSIYARRARTRPAPRKASDTKFARIQYKEVWNSVSETEDDAKMAVSGYTDEEIYRSTGVGTRDMLKQNVGMKPTDVVLEIGCGVGRAGAFVAPACKEWIGVDVSENMLAHTRKRLAHLTNFRTVAGNGYDLSGIESESVDLVYCTVVFMHLDEWERYNYIREGMRVLRPGGRMIVDNVDLTTDIGWQFFEEHCRIPPADRPPNISMTSTPDELRTYFTRAGFQGVEVRRWQQWVVAWGHKPA